MEVTQDKFFLFGAVCFLIIGLATLYGFISQASILQGWEKVVRLAQVAFNLGLAYFFYFMYKSTQQSKLTVADFDKMLNETE